MLNSIPRGWAVHGVFAQTELMAGVLPRHGVHFLTGNADNERDAIIADLAVAAASDVVACGLSAPDKNGARASLAGWFGRPAGAATGVALLTGKGRADSLSRSIAASALARGIGRPLPVAALDLAGNGSGHLTAAHARLNELAAWFKEEHGVGLSLVILDISIALGEIVALQRSGRTVLYVSESAPACVGDDCVVMEIGAGRLTVAKPAQGEPWARQFDLDVVRVAEADALTVRHGKAVEPAPIWKAAPPVAAAPVAQEPEIKIVSRVALIVSRGEVPAELRARWIGEGYSVVQSQEAALPKPGEIVGGKREIVISGEDQRAEELRGRATRLREEAIRLGVNDEIVINVAA